MKKFYTIIAVLALLANTAYGATSSVKLQGNSQPVEVKSFVTNAMHQSRADGMEIIYDQPEGTTLKEMSRKSCAYTTYDNNSAELINVDYAITTFAEAEDGTLYIFNPIWAYATSSWAKLDKVEDGKYVMHTPQLMYEYIDEYDPSWSMSERLVKIKQTFNDDGSVNMALDTDTDITFTMTDGVLTMDGGDSVVLGLMNIDNDWMFVGDYNLSFSTITEELVTLEDGTQNFMSYYDAYGDAKVQMTNVKIDGSTIYIGALPGLDKNIAIKGTIADGKATFPAGQFLGHDEIDAYYAFFLPGTLEVYEEEVWDEYWEEWYVQQFQLFTPSESLEFDYDATTGNLTSKGTFIINPGKVASEKATVVSEPVMEPWEDVVATPADPIVDWVEIPSNENNFYGWVNFKMSILADDGVTLLNPDNLYYTIFYDDQPFELSMNTGYYIEEPMTEIPYNYTSYDVMFTGNDHTVMLWQFVSNRIGIQVIYYGSGEVRKSNIVYYGEETGIEDAVAEKEVESVVYYDLMGRKVTNPNNGLFIKSTTFTDGSIANKKVAL